MNKFIKAIAKSVFLFFIICLIISYAVGFYEGYSLKELFPFGIVSIVLDYPGGCSYPNISKPVIYLYPTEEQKTLVQLDFKGNIIYDYPDYNKEIGGWEVTAYPDGRLINLEDGKEYSYIFWEGQSYSNNYDLSTGFVVSGKDTKIFLQEALSKLGLTPKEYNEFIVYWYPLMENNKYNLIHFASEEYTETAKLIITPKPDSVLRVFMVFKSLDEKININPQELESFNRFGFAVVEWGGAEVK
jgi:hypothetical protein